MTELQEKLNEATQMLNAEQPDKARFTALQDYVLRNSSRLKGDAEFEDLQSTLEKIALHFNLPTLRSLRENFGLNSCSQ